VKHILPKALHELWPTKRVRETSIRRIEAT
jgi:hypothetical protein